MNQDSGTDREASEDCQASPPLRSWAKIACMVVAGLMAIAGVVGWWKQRGKSTTAPALKSAAATPQPASPEPVNVKRYFNFEDYEREHRDGAVARLQGRLARGEFRPAHDRVRGYLPAVLKELQVPPASQTLVFSKSSLQKAGISPHTPRALFFNETIYVGWVPGAGELEIAEVHPQLGTLFFAMDQSSGGKPAIVRNNAQCLECHRTLQTLGIPGLLVNSFTPDEKGMIVPNRGLYVNHRTPLPQRWGGWYVVGEHGKQSHLGNLFGAAAFARHEAKPLANGNLASLGKFVPDLGSYPQPTSDIVALLVLDHQTHLQNFLARLHYENVMTREEPYRSVVVDAFLKNLLLVDEAPLDGRVTGGAEFAKWFESQGPKDRKGRSLRQLDLQTRLFKYPCSYTIYSTAFDALPETLKSHLYKRLWDILNGKDQTPVFRQIPVATRRALLEILADTQKTLPGYWKAE